MLCTCCRNTEHLNAVKEDVPPYLYMVTHCDRCGERCDNRFCSTLRPNSNGTYGRFARRSDSRIPRRLV